MINQTRKRIQVITVNPVISPPHKTTEMSGNQGTKGTRKALGRCGCFRRSRITPSDTNTNANRDPMFDKSAASLTAKIPAGSPTAKPAIHVEMCGVLYRECTFENILGNKPSRDIAYQMRACPY